MPAALYAQIGNFSANPNSGKFFFYQGFYLLREFADAERSLARKKRSRVFFAERIVKHFGNLHFPWNEKALAEIVDVVKILNAVGIRFRENFFIN